LTNLLFPVKTTLRCGGRLLDLSQPVVMGILNYTPDSFYAGSRVQRMDTALRQTERMLTEGATIIDIGGQSSRPGAEEVVPDEELMRILPILRALQQRFPEAYFSIDTCYAEVAKSALENGAHLINDISGGHRDPTIYAVAAQFGAPYLLMHMRGTPSTMQQQTDYGDIVADLIDYFQKKVAICVAAGITDIIIDPGFGFSKNMSQNYELLRRLKELSILGLPLLAGLSRKSMLYKPFAGTPETALNATTAANMLALQNGVSILRVHDVKEAMECIKVFQEYNKI